MAISQEIPSRVYLNRLLSRLPSKSRTSTTTEEWAFPDQSFDFLTTTAFSGNNPDRNTLAPIDLPFLVTTQVDQLLADEPLRDPTSTAESITLSPTTTPCYDWKGQRSGLRMAVGLSIVFSVLLALGLVYVFFLYHRLKHGSRDAESGKIFIYLFKSKLFIKILFINVNNS